MHVIRFRLSERPRVHVRGGRINHMHVMRRIYNTRSLFTESSAIHG